MRSSFSTSSWRVAWSFFSFSKNSFSSTTLIAWPFNSALMTCSQKIRKHERGPFSIFWGVFGGFPADNLGSVALTQANLVSGDELGYAISYAIGQSAPLVATLWGLLWYREFTGSPSPVYGYRLAWA